MAHQLIFAVPLAVLVFFVLLEPLRYAFTNTRLGIGTGAGARSASVTLIPAVVVSAIIAGAVGYGASLVLLPTLISVIPLAVIIFAILVYVLLGAFSMTGIGAGRAGPRSSATIWSLSIVVSAIISAVVAFVLSVLI